MSDASTAREISRWSVAAEVARPWYRSRSAAQHVGIVAQLAALLGLLYFLEIEPGSGLPRILPLVFAGFLAHAALPLTYRLRFFLGLSIAAIAIVLGPAQGAAVVLIALGLVSICHLRLAFSVRVVLLAIAGAGLAIFRAGAQSSSLAFHIPAAALAVIGSMFMFRIIIYMYDLRHEESAQRAGRNIPGGDASLWARLTYFLLLPNVCFLLFPVVDYKTFRRTYYDSEATAIYQKGVWLMALGLAHLLAYRLVYHYLVIGPEQAESLGGVLRFMVSSYLVYLRVVGQFHLVIGLLCLFGFNLPPAHRFFLLAASFTDFWRRTRIDWKDFMVKVFYFPASVPLQRRWGTTLALVVATAGVFIATWLLHSYQWFWLRGDFPVSANDAVFWGIFGGCVLVNSVLEARRRRAPATTFTFRDAALNAARVVAMFAFLSLLWSYWRTPSLGDWLWTLSALRRARPLSYAKLVVATTVAIGTIALAHLALVRLSGARGRKGTTGRPSLGYAVVPPAFRSLGVGVVAAALLLVVLPARRGAFGASAQHLAETIGTNRLNAADRLREDRGYYETLLDVRPSVAEPVDAATEAAEAGGFIPLTRSRFVRTTNDLLGYELVSSYRGGFLRGLPFETNRWGMRDREYALIPPPNTYRIALLGASYEMGASVKVEQRFEWRLEERLNREGPGMPARHYEILNFAVGGYSVLQCVPVAEKKVFRFSPNAVIVSIKTRDFARSTDALVVAIRGGADIPYPELRDILHRAGVERGMSELQLRSRIKQILPEILQWSLNRIGQSSHAHGARAIAVVMPMTDPRPDDIGVEDQLAAWARQAGFSVIRLTDVYAGHARASIRIPPPDGHPNALGHQLIADKLFQILRDNDDSLLGLGFQARR